MDSFCQGRQVEKKGFLFGWLISGYLVGSRTRGMHTESASTDHL